MSGSAEELHAKQVKWLQETVDYWHNRAESAERELAVQLAISKDCFELINRLQKKCTGMYEALKMTCDWVELPEARCLEEDRAFLVNTVYRLAHAALKL